MRTKRRVKLLSLFNHKGGVSKTTTAFNLGWALAERGHTVLLVDADPQCNLTGMTLELSGREDLGAFYEDEQTSNIFDSLRPAFAGQPRALEAATPARTGHDRLLLLAGHIDLATYEPELPMAQKVLGAMPVMANLPGAIGHLVAKLALNDAIYSQQSIKHGFSPYCRLEGASWWSEMPLGDESLLPFEARNTLSQTSRRTPPCEGP